MGSVKLSAEVMRIVKMVAAARVEFNKNNFLEAAEIMRDAMKAMVDAGLWGNNDACARMSALAQIMIEKAQRAEMESRLT